MTNKVFVYIDQFKGEALPASWEVVGAGRSLAEQVGGEVTALVIGHEVEKLAEQAFQNGADEVLIADDTILADYRAEPYTSIAAKVVQDADIVLFPTTSRGRELAAMTAFDLDTGVLTDVTELELEGEEVIATKPVYAGKVLAKVVCRSKPQIITLRNRAFSRPESEPSRSGSLTKVDVEISEDEISTKVGDYAEAEGGVSLTDARVIVSGGRGVAMNPDLEPPESLDEKEAEIWKAQQGLELVKELAETLGGAVGASRAAVDAGYIPYKHQVGQTGKVVSPDLYIACGISGAIQHQAGMRTSKTIVAINTDGDAPIFKLCRFGVVGDLYDVLPPLIEAFRKRLN